MKKIWQANLVIPTRVAVEKKKKKKIMAISKLFALHANAILCDLWKYRYNTINKTHSENKFYDRKEKSQTKYYCIRSKVIVFLKISYSHLYLLAKLELTETAAGGVL